MEIVKKTKSGIYVRQHPKFGTLVFSPFSGLFYAVAEDYSDEMGLFCAGKKSNLPEIIIQHLNIGINSPNNTKFDIEHWLPSKQSFSDFEELPDKQPIVLNWLISNKCNCNCAYCYAGDVIDKEFEDIDIKTIADKLLSMNPLAVVLSGGEPMIEKSKIKDALAVLGGKTGVIIDTNGLIYDKELTSLFKKNNVVIRVSLDSLINDVNTKVRPQRDKKLSPTSVSKIVEHIHLYKQAGITVLVHTVLSSINKVNLDDLSSQLPLIGVNGWRVFSVARPNDEAKKESFEKVMKFGKVKSLDDAEKNIQRDIIYFEKRYKSKSNFSIQILKNSNSQKNSVILITPDGKFMTENMFKSAKTLIDPEQLFKKVDLRSHYERYLGQI